jgi:hypothetical protein
MLLAEALTRRGDLMKKLVELKDRATSNARYQEGDEPLEDAMTLAAQWQATLTELTVLIGSINHTNSVTRIAGPESDFLTDALALRDLRSVRRMDGSVDSGQNLLTPQAVVASVMRSGD